MRGGAGADVLDDRAGADTIVAGIGADVLIGGAGSDVLWLGYGADHAVAGTGVDFVCADARDGAVDVVDCGPGTQDRVWLRPDDSSIRCECVIRLG